ncbi:DUF2339 domain-containing protein [Effusibacillus consociatus]|uniref:DUF2339 domain-containing protein n=1 Tax=Effusibacillus consociatus TaxID=1117041 RepID=A0ABV9Q736_9BACL
MSEINRMERLEKLVEEQGEEIRLLRQQVELLQQSLNPVPTIKRDVQQPAVREVPVKPARVQQEPNKEVEPKKEPEKVDWEHFIGRVWLPRIFILVLLLGVIWGFKAAINAGLLTEPVRCGMGLAASIVLLYLGERQMRLNRDALGQVLLGGAVSLLMLTTFAAHILYGLIPAVPAFLLNVGFIAGGIFLSVRHRSEALAILSSIGGYMVPFLIKSTAPSTVFFVGYEVLLSATFLVLSVRKGYEKLYYASLGLFHLTLLVFAGFVHIADEHVLAIGVLAQHVVILALLFLRWKMGETQSITLFTSAAVTTAWWYGLLGNTDSRFYEGFLLVLAIFYGGVALWRRKDSEDQVAAYVSISAFSLMIYLIHVFQGSSEAVALLAEGTGVLILALLVRSGLQLATGTVVYLLGLLLTLKEPIGKIVSGPTLAWVVLLGTLTLLFRQIRKSTEGENELQIPLQLPKGIALSGAVLLLVFLTQITDVLAEPLSRDGKHMAISFTWAFSAIAVILFGIIKRIKLARLFGVILLFVTLLKLILIDLPSVSVLVRAVLFIGLGAIGVAISRFFYQKKE